MKKNRMLALLLSVVLLMTAGCGNAVSTVEGSSQAEENLSTAVPELIVESAEPANVPERVEPEISATESEAEPEPVMITYPLTETSETLSLYCTACNFMGPLSNVSMDWEDFDCFQQIEALTNVHIDFQTVSFEAYQSNYNIYIAAGDYADLLINVEASYVGGTSSAYEAGVIVDVEPYLQEYAPDYYALLNGDTQFQAYAYNSEGRVLDFISAYDKPGVKNGSIVRGDWLESLNMEINNIDDLHKYLLAAKNQFGCEVPVYMTQTSNEYMTAFGIQSYKVGGSDLSFYAVDGEVRTPLNQAEYQDYLRTMNQWYQEGLIYQDFATKSYDPHDNTLTQMIYNGQVAIWATQLEGLDDYAASSPVAGFISTPVPQLTLDGDKNHLTEVEYIIGDSDICISTNCENVPLAVSWMNYWYTDAGIRMYNYGPENDAYHLDGDTVVLENFVLDNEYGVDISSFLRMYCPYGSFTGIYLRGRLTDYSSDLQKQAEQIWTDSNDGAWVMPKGVSLEATANEELSSIAADIMTYADSCIPKFIMGDMDIETDWDTFQSTMESMGLSRCVAIEQEAYDSCIG
jgi:putative aldouronate transport system substrate-binding protein